VTAALEYLLLVHERCAQKDRSKLDFCSSNSRLRTSALEAISKRRNLKIRFTETLIKLVNLESVALAFRKARPVSSSS
jgi:hypothetical protein